MKLTFEQRLILIAIAYADVFHVPLDDAKEFVRAELERWENDKSPGR